MSRFEAAKVRESIGLIFAAGVPTQPPVRNERILVLKAGGSERNYWSDLVAYRELFLILAWRDLAVRYKQTTIGVAWAIIRPLITLIIFSVVFGRVAKLPSEGAAPYSLLVFAGMLPWTLFSTILSDASSSLVTNANLISKVYFPRLIVPAATIIVALVDFAVTFVLLLFMMAAFGVWPTWRIILLPLLVVLASGAAFGPALLMAAMNVKYRDFRHIIPFALQLGLYISPVGFSSSVVPSQWRLLYSMNPAVGVIDGFRWCLLRDATIYLPGMWISISVAVLFVWLGVTYFRNAERDFADLV